MYEAMLSIATSARHYRSHITTSCNTTYHSNEQSNEIPNHFPFAVECVIYYLAIAAVKINIILFSWVIMKISCFVWKFTWYSIWCLHAKYILVFIFKQGKKPLQSNLLIYITEFKPFSLPLYLPISWACVQPCTHSPPQGKSSVLLLITVFRGMWFFCRECVRNFLILWLLASSLSVKFNCWAYCLCVTCSAGRSLKSTKEIKCKWVL